MNLEEAIKALGLSEKQAKVYLSLLKLGRASAQAVSSDSGLKRPTVYVILDELEKEGIVHEIPKATKKLYRPLSPHLLLERVEKKIKLAKSAMPEIEALLRSGGEKPQALYFEGVNGVKEALRYKQEELKEKEIVGFWAKTNDEIMKTFDNYKERNDAWKRNKVTMRGFAPEDESLREFREKDREYRRNFKVLPQSEYSSDVAVEIADDHVSFFDFINLQALVIDNPQITKTMQEIFEIAWRAKAEK